MTSEKPAGAAATSLPVPRYVSRRSAFLGVSPIRDWRIRIIGLSSTAVLPDDAAVNAAVGVATRSLPERPRVPEQEPVGFVVVHSGAEALWVIVGWWDLDILHHRLFRADLGTTSLSAVAPGGPTACVWELLVIEQERQAWVKHVLSRPEAPDYNGYLASSLEVTESAQPAPAMTVERLQEFSAAWGRGDVDRLMTFMTDDCVYVASVGPEPGRTYRGRVEVRRGFEEFLAHDTGGVPHSGHAFVHGDVGAVEWSYEFTEPDGTIRRVLGCDLFRFRGDCVSEKNAFRKVLS
jgi:ketosteroid isomerase-like protein